MMNQNPYQKLRMRLLQIARVADDRQKSSEDLEFQCRMFEANCERLKLDVFSPEIQDRLAKQAGHTAIAFRDEGELSEASRTMIGWMSESVAITIAEWERVDTGEPERYMAGIECAVFHLQNYANSIRNLGRCCRFRVEAYLGLLKLSLEHEEEVPKLQDAIQSIIEASSGGDVDELQGAIAQAIDIIRPNGNTTATNHVARTIATQAERQNSFIESQAATTICTRQGSVANLGDRYIEVWDGDNMVRRERTDVNDPLKLYVGETWRLIKFLFLKAGTSFTNGECAKGSGVKIGIVTRLKPQIKSLVGSSGRIGFRVCTCTDCVQKTNKKN